MVAIALALLFAAGELEPRPVTPLGVPAMRRAIIVFSNFILGPIAGLIVLGFGSLSAVPFALAAFIAGPIEATLLTLLMRAGMRKRELVGIVLVWFWLGAAASLLARGF